MTFLLYHSPRLIAVGAVVHERGIADAALLALYHVHLLLLGRLGLCGGRCRRGLLWRGRWGRGVLRLLGRGLTNLTRLGLVLRILRLEDLLELDPTDQHQYARDKADEECQNAP